MSLKEQMLKAGLITEQDAKRAEHRKKTENKQAGHKTREKEAEKRRKSVASEKEAQRRADQARNRQRESTRAEHEAQVQQGQRQRSALETVYRDGLLSKWEGPRKYYYVHGGKVVYLMVSDDVGRRLENGQAAIAAAEKNPNRACILHAGAARKLKELDPARLLTFHGT